MFGNRTMPQKRVNQADSIIRNERVRTTGRNKLRERAIATKRNKLLERANETDSIIRNERTNERT